MVLPDTPPAASVNRVRIIDIPSVDIDDAVRGKQAYHLLSAPALIRYAQDAADALQLPESYREADPASPQVRGALPKYVDACLRAESEGLREAAGAVARRLGRNLGHLAIALCRGDSINREARVDWPDAAWERWRTIRFYQLGGGVMGGELGSRLVHEANAFLTEVGYAHRLSISRSPRPRHMGLLGIGRAIPSAATQRRAYALCLDLGQTSVKRAILRYDRGLLAGLHWLPSVPVRWQWRNRPDAAEGIDPDAVLAFTVRAIVEGIELAHAQGFMLCDDVGISIAAYVRGGKLLGHGLYARLTEISEDAAALMTRAIAQTSGLDVRPVIAHDGTASAALHAGEVDTAVLVIGTAIGVGFPPDSSEGLCPIAERLGIGETHIDNRSAPSTA
jgi:hypothetical protein